MNKIVILISLVSMTAQTNAELNSYQLFSRWKNQQGQPQVVTSDNKFNTPIGTLQGAQTLRFSYSRQQTTIYHPSAESIFPQQSNLSNLLNAFLSSIEKDTYFLVYFNRLQCIILRELYQYLLKVFANFLLISNNSLENYLETTSLKALNHKTLIINHLVELIESQAHHAILFRFPTLPEKLATNVGFTILKQDYGADLDLLINPAKNDFGDQKTQSFFENMQSLYLQILGNYLIFFKAYGQTIQEAQDALSRPKFAAQAQYIQKIMEPYLQTPQSVILQEKINISRQAKTINPPLFFYNEKILENINLLIYLGLSLPPNTQRVAWPEHIIKKAQEGSPIRNKAGNVISILPAAYFQNEQGNITNVRNQDSQLFINIPTVNEVYSQELIQEPEWLNSSRGVLLMIRMCLGDYSVLFDPLFENEEIFDPCIRCILMKSAIQANMLASSGKTNAICKNCENYLNGLKKLVPVSTEQPSPPTLDPSLLP